MDTEKKLLENRTGEKIAVYTKIVQGVKQREVIRPGEQVELQNASPRGRFLEAGLKAGLTVAKEAKENLGKLSHKEIVQQKGDAGKVKDPDWEEKNEERLRKGKVKEGKRPGLRKRIASTVKGG